MNELLSIIKKQKIPNIYQLSLNIFQEDLDKLCQEYNYKLFYFNGANIFNKTDFFETSRQVMKFPDYFGNNWDAWEECVTDLSWIPSSSYLFVYRNTENFATNSPQDWAILLDIFHSTISYWQQQNVSFFVILLK